MHQPILLLILTFFFFTCGNSDKIDRKKAREFSEFISPSQKAFPSFPGCEQIKNAGDRMACNMKKAREHVEEHYVHPEKLRETLKEGFVDVEFTVTPSGALQNFVILNSFDEDCSQIAKDIVKKIPRMIPPLNEGKSISSKYSIRVNFKTPKEEKFEMTTMYSRNEFYYATPISTPPLFGKCGDTNSKEAIELCLQENLFNYFQEVMNFPPVPKKSKKISIISFIVTKDGSIKNIQGGGLWNEAIEATIYKMPKWSPGKMDGKPVNTLFKIMHPFTEKSLKNKNPNWEKIKQLKGNPKNEKPLK